MSTTASHPEENKPVPSSFAAWGTCPAGTPLTITLDPMPPPVGDASSVSCKKLTSSGGDGHWFVVFEDVPVGTYDLVVRKVQGEVLHRTKGVSVVVMLVNASYPPSGSDQCHTVFTAYGTVSSPDTKAKDCVFAGETFPITYTSGAFFATQFQAQRTPSNSVDMLTVNGDNGGSATVMNLRALAR